MEIIDNEIYFSETLMPLQLKSIGTSEDFTNYHSICNYITNSLFLVNNLKSIVDIGHPYIFDVSDKLVGYSYYMLDENFNVYISKIQSNTLYYHNIDKNHNALSERLQNKNDIFYVGKLKSELNLDKFFVPIASFKKSFDSDIAFLYNRLADALQTY